LGYYTVMTLIAAASIRLNVLFLLALLQGGISLVRFTGLAWEVLGQVFWLVGVGVFGFVFVVGLLSIPVALIYRL
jgi:hypothetical protein